MSTTVTYKGETLTTVSNDTATLETGGTWLEDDITLTDVSGSTPTGTKNISITANGTTTEDVTNYATASITANVPNTYSAGDEGKVVDNGALVSQTSATYTANDTYDTTLINEVTVNVSGGGGDTDHWVRPSEWPDLSKLARTDEVVYITCRADEENGYLILNCITTNNAAYNVEIGEIVNNAFVSSGSWTWASNSTKRVFFGTSLGGYKVFRITPPASAHIRSFQTGENDDYANFTDAVGAYESKAVLGWWSGVLEVYGNLPYINYFCGARTCKFIQSFDIKNPAPTTLGYAFAYCSSLVNVDVSTWDTSNCTNMDSAFRQSGIKFFNGYESLDVKKVTALSRAFEMVHLKTFDMSDWDLEKATNMGNMFENAKELEEVYLKSSDVACTYANMFYSCTALKKVDVTDFSASNANSIASMFRETYVLTDIDFGSLNLSGITSAGNAQNVFQQSRSVAEITVPASLAYIGNQFFEYTELCREYHFKATTPPALNNTNAFTRMTNLGGKKIVVPYSADHSVLNAYKTATNWSSYSSYMEEESA